MHVCLFGRLQANLLDKIVSLNLLRWINLVNVRILVAAELELDMFDVFERCHERSAVH